jgi:uncharacterized protein (DUF983 family)
VGHQDDTTEEPDITLGIAAHLFMRALRLRCPRCGKGHLYSRGFKMYERCPVCGWVFEREEGYWTGAMGINLVVTEVLVTAGVVVPAALQAPLLPLLSIGIAAAILLPILFYRHAKSFWMAIDFLIHPVPIW